MSDDQVEAVVEPCTICGRPTEQACVDCFIDAGADQSPPHVCEQTTCMDAHDERVHARRPP